MTAGGRQVVHLHVGTPKSGTTFLQRELSRNRDLLREHGYLYPGEDQSHFIATMSLRRRGFRGHTYDRAEGAWQRIVDEVNAYEGPALVSHEMMGGSDLATIRRAVGSFPGRDVRVVVTCRDLGRQLPAVWQEGVKNGNTDSYAEFLTESLAAWNGVRARRGVWLGQNLASLGQRWGSVVGADHVVFVTVPPAGSDTGDLWRRFADAVGLPDVELRPAEGPRNPSLGTVETELLRRVNDRIPDDLPWPRRSRLVKRRFAQQTLVKHRTGGSLAVPPEHHDATREIASQMCAQIRSAGHGVVGDLADLEPHFRAGGTLPDQVGDDQLLSLALDLLVPMVLKDAPVRRPATAVPPAAPRTPQASARALLGRLRRRLGRASS